MSAASSTVMADNRDDEEAVVRPELHGQDGTVELNGDRSKEEADEAAKREAAAAAAAAAHQADAEQQTDGDAAANPADADNQGLEGEKDEENEDGKPKKPPTQRQVSFSVGNVPSLARPWELPPAED